MRGHRDGARKKGGAKRRQDLGVSGGRKKGINSKMGAVRGRVKVGGSDANKMGRVWAI